jgi:protein FrlC
VQLAYSTNAFTRSSLHDAIDCIADLGFAGVEILCDHPHWLPGRVDATEVGKIAELISSHGLAVSNLNANTANFFFDPRPAENVFEPALSSAIPEYRRWRVENTVRAIELADSIGAPCVSVTAGRPIPGCPPEIALDYLVDSLQRICDAAATHDIRVGVEYEPGLMIERATELADLWARVDSPHLGANWDIGHSFLDGETPEAAIELLGTRIWNVHVEDIKARKHFHLVPGTGDLPFERYFDALRGVGYEGFLTVELYSYPEQPVAVGRQSLEYLEPLL